MKHMQWIGYKYTQTAHQTAYTTLDSLYNNNKQQILFKIVIAWISSWQNPGLLACPPWALRPWKIWYRAACGHRLHFEDQKRLYVVYISDTLSKHNTRALILQSCMERRGSTVASLCRVPVRWARMIVLASAIYDWWLLFQAVPLMRICIYLR